MEIEPILCLGHENYYQNPDLKRLTELCFDSSSYELIFNILLIIKNPKLSHELLEKFKENPKTDNKMIYEEIGQIMNNIYNNKDIGNLRGTFLEMIIYEYMNRKYDINNSKYAKIEYNCFVNINGEKSNKTVDIYALCGLNGFVCECKIGIYNLDEYDISNLNQLHINSNKILNPYIFTLSYAEQVKEHIMKILI